MIFIVALIVVIAGVFLVLLSAMNIVVLWCLLSAVMLSASS